MRVMAVMVVMKGDEELNPAGNNSSRDPCSRMHVHCLKGRKRDWGTGVEDSIDLN